LEQLHPVGCFAWCLRDRLDQFGAPVEQAHAVVCAMGFAQCSVRDETVDEGSACSFGVIVDAVVERQ
jgi:hypothetical protein